MHKDFAENCNERQFNQEFVRLANQVQTVPSSVLLLQQQVNLALKYDNKSKMVFEDPCTPVTKEHRR